MRIAIVDDEATELVTTEGYFRKHIRDHYPKEEPSLQIDTFLSAEELLREFRSGRYDLMILDICLKKISGIQAAQMIRERDSDVAIVFLTGVDDFLMEGYRVFAAGYFLKPLAEHGEDFAKTFAHIFPKLKERHMELSVQVGKLSFSVPYRNIRYVDINWKHQLCLHLPDQEILPTMAYEEVKQVLLKDARFLECHHRILVNMDEIISMGKEAFVLRPDVQVPISQRRQKEAKSKYMHYLASR